MRYLVFAAAGAIIGVLVMLGYTFGMAYNEAEQVIIDCKPTSMYAISAARKMRVYNCDNKQ